MYPPIPHAPPDSGQRTDKVHRGGRSGTRAGRSGDSDGDGAHRASCIAQSEHRASNIGGRAIRLTMGRWMRCAAVHGAQSHSLRLTGAPIEPASTHIHLHLHLTDGIDRARAILLRSFARVRSTVFLRAVRIASPAPNRIAIGVQAVRVRGGVRVRRRRRRRLRRRLTIARVHARRT